jgi:hypothetical protein
MSRKPRRPRGKRDDRREARPSSPADVLRQALEEMQEGEQTSRRAGWRERQHVDDYREVAVDGMREGLSEALLRLTEEAHTNRDRLLEEQRPKTQLPRARRGGGEDPQNEAEAAAREIKEEMDRLGIEEQTHYYTARERAETGEVDRTYQVDNRVRKRPRRGRKKRS